MKHAHCLLFKTVTRINKKDHTALPKTNVVSYAKKINTSHTSLILCNKLKKENHKAKN